MEKKSFGGITGSTLKIIAILLMLIDHIGVAIFEHGLLQAESIISNHALWKQLLFIDRILRLIGRPAFPLFCFLLVEGFLHTRDMKKYTLRLLLFAFISEIPFDLAVMGDWVSFQYQNVFFTLLIGLLVMIAATYFQKNPWMQILVYIMGMAAGYFLKTDYGYKGILLIEILYVLRYNRKLQALGGALSFSWELTAPLAFVPILFYNGKRGISLRYFFYWFYPVHLLILGLIGKLILHL